MPDKAGGRSQVSEASVARVHGLRNAGRHILKSKAAKLIIFKIFIIFTIVAIAPLTISAIFYWSGLSLSHLLCTPFAAYVPLALGEGLSLKLDLGIGLVLSTMFKFTVNNINIVNNFIQEVLLYINSLMQAHVLVPATSGASHAEGSDFNLGKPATSGGPDRPAPASGGVQGNVDSPQEGKPAFEVNSGFSRDWS